MKSIKVLFSILILLACSLIVSAAIPDIERQALIALYNSTNGDSWRTNSGWKTAPLHTDGFSMPGTEGAWHGINVTSDHVSHIYLSSNLLQGCIPDELGNLSNLKVLHFYLNELTDNIPLSLSNLSNLQELSLSVNHLTGSIPTELGNLNNLELLWLDSNDLTGTIPPSLGNLSNLKYLWLSNNELTGSIPPALGNLNNLNHFWLSYTLLSGSIPSEVRQSEQPNRT